MKIRYPLPGVITKVQTKEPVMALTFDDGPNPDATPDLLRLLEKHGAKATFFMVGSAAARHRHLVRRVAEEGHSIGNHTWDHPVLPRTPRAERLAQLRACQRALEPYGRRLFRPPYLAISKKARLDALLLRYKVIMGSVDSRDWFVADGETIAETLLAAPMPGDIIVLHDGLCGFENITLSHAPVPARDGMLAGLELFLTELSGRFRFVTIPELLRVGRPVRTSPYRRGPRPLQPQA
jgi:peptidoglycan-N-acetylglucosamine deacetylase